MKYNLVLPIFTIFICITMIHGCYGEISNGDFETGDLTGWHRQDVGGLAEFYINDTDPFEGTYCLAVVADTVFDDGVLATDEPVQTESEYLNYSIKIPVFVGTESMLTVTALDDTTQVYDAYTTSMSEWTNISLDITSLENRSTFGIIVQVYVVASGDDANVSALLDVVSVGDDEEEPCPDCPTQEPQIRKLEASFDRTPKTGSCPLTVTFTDTSLDYLVIEGGEYKFVEEPYTRTWNFGDGTIIEDGAAVVNHTYLSDGKYTVLLTISNDTTRSKMRQYNSVYVQGAMYPNPTTTFGEPSQTLNDANFDPTKYAELLPQAYTGVLSMSSANGWFFFWGFVFMFIFLAIFIRLEDVSLLMLFGLLVAGSVLAVLPSDFRLIGQGFLILAVASVIYILIKGRFR